MKHRTMRAEVDNRVWLIVVLVAGVALVAAPSAAAPPGTVSVPSVLETVPTGVAGDTADDPAIWVNSSSPAGVTLVITNEKKGG